MITSCTWLQLKAVLEQTDSGEHIETQPRPGHCHHQSPHISQVTYIVGPDQGEEDVVILLTLVLVHCCYLVRHACQPIRNENRFV